MIDTVKTPNDPQHLPLLQLMSHNLRKEVDTLHVTVNSIRERLNQITPIPEVEFKIDPEPEPQSFSQDLGAQINSLTIANNNLLNCLQRLSEMV